jgi:hypothetical protein
MSTIDIVSSRVTSATPPTSSPRNRHASRNCSSTSDHAGDPSRGGVVIMRGPSTSASPPIHASHVSIASASFLENVANCSWFPAASSS